MMLRPIDYILQPDEGIHWLRNAPQEFWWWFTSERIADGYNEPAEYFPSRVNVLCRFARNIIDPRYWWYCAKDREWPWGGLLDALRWPE